MTTTTIDRATATAAVITAWTALGAARQAALAVWDTPAYGEANLECDGCMTDLENAVKALAATAE